MAEERIVEPFREIESLSSLLFLIPEKAQRLNSLAAVDIHIKSISVCRRYLAVGTNICIVYIVDRKSRTISQKVKVGSKNDDVTKVLLTHKNGFYLLVFGTESGQLAFLTSERLSPNDNISDSVISTSLSQGARITSIVFNDDVTELYVGDFSGGVTVFSLQQPISNLIPKIVVKECEPIIQLGFSCFFLLISTAQDCYIYNTKTTVSTKIGSKSLKINGMFGSCFMRSDSGQGDTCNIYCSRPGLRMWRCSTEGSVLTTHLYKNLVSSAHHVVVPGELKKEAPECNIQLGILEVIRCGLILSWNESCILIIDANDLVSTKLQVICSNISKVTDVSRYSDEIFILADGVKRRLYWLPQSMEMAINQLDSADHTESSEKMQIDAPKQVAEGYLPPLIEAFDLPALKVDTDKITQQEQKSINMKLLEEKFQSGLTSVKEKLTIKGDDFKLMGSTVRQGFGKLFSKVQKSAQRSAADVGLTTEINTVAPKPEFVVKLDTNHDTPSEEIKIEKSENSLNSLSSSTNDDTCKDLKNSTSIVQSISSTIPQSTQNEQRPSSATIENDSDFVERLRPHHMERITIRPLDTSTVNSESYHPDKHDVLLNEDAHKSHVEACTNTDQDDNHSSKQEPHVVGELSSSPKSSSGEFCDTVGRFFEKLKVDPVLDGLQQRLNSVLLTEPLHAPTFGYEFFADENQKLEDGSEVTLTERRFTDEVDYENDSDKDDEGIDENSDVKEENEREVDEDDIYNPKRRMAMPIDPVVTSTVDADTHGSSGDFLEDRRFCDLVTKERWLSHDLISPAVCLSLSRQYFWIIDKDNIVYVGQNSNSTIIWKKMDFKASHISVSLTGDLAWRVYKQVAYAGSNRVPSCMPSKMKWSEAVPDVTSAFVNDSSVLYIKKNNQIWCQEHLSRDRPMGRSNQISCKYTMTKICRRAGITWALSSDGRLYYCIAKPHEKTEWEPVYSANNISCFCLSPTGQACWIIDRDDVLWYTDGIGKETPAGSGSRWQVSYCEKITHENRHKFKNILLRKPVSSGQSHIAVTKDLICLLSSDNSQSLRICSTHQIGYRWLPLITSTLTSSSAWKDVCWYGDDLVLSLYESGDLMLINPATGYITGLALPKGLNCLTIRRISACSKSIWILTDTEVHYSLLKHGVNNARLAIKWQVLDNLQFDNKNIKDISVGDAVAWALDDVGNIYMCVGINIKRKDYMKPAWIPIDSLHKDVYFTSIYTNELCTKVWALDSSGNVFVRKGVTESLPVGESWQHVIGINASKLSVSNNLVWAIGQNSGDVFCRCCSTDSNPAGEYWKKIPAHLATISSSPSDNLVGLSSSGQFLRCEYKVIGSVKDCKKPENIEMDGDWEIV